MFKKNKNKNKEIKKRSRQLALFTIPGFIWLIVFCYLPMFGLALAFKDYKNFDGNFFTSLFKSDWTLKNFQVLFRVNNLGMIIRNTLGYNIVFIILNIVIPLIVAIMLHELLNRRSAKVYQTVTFLPYFLSWIVISYSVYAFLSYDGGLFNQIRSWMGLKPINWYRTPGVWPYIFVFLNTWKSLGYNTIIYLAALAGIDRSLYEAASIDGASKLQQAWNITIPLLRPVIVITFVLALGGIFRSDFGLFFHVPNSGGPGGTLREVAEVIDTYTYRLLMISQNLKQSAAIGFVQSVIGFILISTANFIVKKYDPDRALY
ncbi:ABC transporter permease [Helcococcus kunzii]|uniref:ABC transporter permease n=1 Tax=Helcococcus kunzii TaxID=40091 RepID=UPI0024ADDE56|nr:ABC transporter permease subunit [Helcococcus kunzii]